MTQRMCSICGDKLLPWEPREFCRDCWLDNLPHKWYTKAEEYSNGNATKRPPTHIEILDLRMSMRESLTDARAHKSPSRPKRVKQKGIHDD